MKNVYIFLIAGACLAGMSLQVQAGPRAASSNNENYLVTERDLSGWSVGIYGSQRERDVKLKNSGARTSLDESRVLAYAGYRLFSWVTVYLYAGQRSTDLGSSSDSGTAMGGSLEFNLLSQLILDPTLEEDRIRIHSSVAYTSSGAESGATPYDYTELEADLTFSIVNEVSGHKGYLPQAIGLTAGILGSVLNGDLEENGESIGYMAGLDVLYTEHITFTFGIDSLDSTGVFAGANLTF